MEFYFQALQFLKFRVASYLFYVPVKFFSFILRNISIIIIISSYGSFLLLIARGFFMKDLMKGGYFMKVNQNLFLIRFVT